ncbi:MAG: hypothetical protein RBR06_10895 [Desulfuromonadaceae bacterium]|nr:hypothetical protein [Desulfuromonadaceae bacterium]
MKKIILLALIAVLTMTGSVLAETVFDKDGIDTKITGTSILNDFKTSNNVTLIALSGAGSYAAVSSHLNGDRVFGSSSGDSILYRSVVGKDAGAKYTTAPSVSDSAEFADDTEWTAL